jgi:hypothetical protein
MVGIRAVTGNHRNVVFNPVILNMASNQRVHTGRRLTLLRQAQWPNGPNLWRQVESRVSTQFGEENQRDAAPNGKDKGY